MMILENVPSSSFVFFKLEITLTVLVIGAWGGIVIFLMKNGSKGTTFYKKVNACLSQIIISCFTGFLLSIIAIEKGLSFNFIILVSGVGGVFAAPILKLIGSKVKSFLFVTEDKSK
ncbi:MULTISPECIES: phage holin family protein [Enterobacterales]|uniref:phage holin family protein n=1 Tax=Enterobacterales TaxID=91347 RepID=UPI002ED9C99C